MASIERLRTTKKVGRLILAPSFKRGSFDSHAVDCPFLFRHDNEFCMTFVGWDGIGYRTGLATSKDLEVWHHEGMIIDRGASGSATEHNVALTSILRDNDLWGSSELRRVDGLFVGTYHAYPGAGYEVGPAIIGLCFSDDLRHWEVGPAVLEPGPEGTWDGGGLYKSWLMEHDGTYYLFYNAKNHDRKGWIEQTGFAVSSDLVTWHKSKRNPVIPIGEPGAFDDLYASDPCVLWDRDRWVMFYYGNSSDGHARDGLALSSDLLEWSKVDELLIDVGPAGSIDDKYAAKPGIITKEGVLYHFYGAVTQFERRRLGEIEHTEIRGITYASNQ